MITVDTIRERLEKLYADVEKREARIAKLEQKRQKLIDKCRSLGLTPFENIQYIERKGHNKYGVHYFDEYDFEVFNDDDRDIIRNSIDMNIRNASMDLHGVVRDIISAKNKLIEIDEKIRDNEERLSKMEEKEQKIYDMPPLFLELIDHMIPECEKNIKFRYDYILSVRASGKTPTEMYRAFGSDYDRALAYDEKEIRQLAERDAKEYVSDLYRRVIKKVGDIVDYHDLYLNGPAINGVVVGEKGTTRLETIMAGGYNIQRLHLRVILH